MRGVTDGHAGSATSADAVSRYSSNASSGFGSCAAIGVSSENSPRSTSCIT
jgi:hypothetical protein